MTEVSFDTANVTTDGDGNLWLCLKVDREDAPKARKFVYEQRPRKHTAKLGEHRNKRSLDANAYCWVLLDKLAEALRIPKTDIYRGLIKEIGGNSVAVCCKTSDVPKVCMDWESNGIGWVTETDESKIKGCTVVYLYAGSSSYDTAQMSRLIDLVVQECRQMGIETLPPGKLEILKEEWGR